MKIFSTYFVKIKHYNHIFEKTAELYQDAVDFYKFPSYLRRTAISEAIGKVSYQVLVCALVVSVRGVRPPLPMTVPAA